MSNPNQPDRPGEDRSRTGSNSAAALRQLARLLARSAARELAGASSADPVDEADEAKP